MHKFLHLFSTKFYILSQAKIKPLDKFTTILLGENVVNRLAQIFLAHALVFRYIDLSIV